MRSYLEEVDLETTKQRFDAFWEREILGRRSFPSQRQERNRRRETSLFPEASRKDGQTASIS